VIPTAPSRLSCLRRRAATAIAATLAALVLAATLPGALLSPAPAVAGTTVNLVGRGWGHGIGLSAWGVYGYATKTDKTYKEILRHYYTGIGFGTVSNSAVRVLLNRGLTRVEVSSDAQFTIKGTKKTLNVPRFTVATIRWLPDRSLYRVTFGDTSETLGSKPNCVQGDEPLLLQQPNQNAGSGRMHYRGTLVVRHYSDGLMVVNQLPIESYLKGVLPCEIYPSWPATAIKVFAVASRTFAVRARGGGPFDVYCTTQSQVYNGFDRERATTNAAIEATGGEIATYGGKPILACYSSSSGGHTENIEYGWPGCSPLPYLKGVSDPYETYDAHGQTGSPHHHWPDNPIRRSAATVDAALGSYSPGTLRAIVVVRRGTSPRVVRAYVLASGGARAISGTDLRSLLGLRSSWVTITTMSLSASRASISSGGVVRLTGRIYPALPAGGRVTLHIATAAGTRTRTITTRRHSQALPDGHSATYSTYTCSLGPGGTTTYSVSSGSSTSPRVTVTVR
jgi:stage II sporulation protein D